MIDYRDILIATCAVISVVQIGQMIGLWLATRPAKSGSWKRPENAEETNWFLANRPCYPVTTLEDLFREDGDNHAAEQ